MNINDISQDKEIKDTSATKEKSNKKRKLIIILVLSLFMLSAVFITVIVLYKNSSANADKEDLKEKYVEPIIKNEKLQLVYDGNDYKIYSCNDMVSLVTFSCTVIGEAPPEGEEGLIQIQALQAQSVNNIGKDDAYTLNVIYKLFKDGNVEYHAMIDSTSLNSDLFFNTKMEYVKGYVHDMKTEKNLDDEKASELFNKHKDEIKDMVNTMYDFYGRENFKEIVQ